jgi:hypothetical protein
MTMTDSDAVAELINSEAIDDAIIAYQYDDVVITPFFRFKSLIGTGTAVGSFPRWVKDSHQDLETEAETMVPEALETTQASVTAGRVGIAREPSETTLEDTVIGRNRFIQEVAMDAAILLGMQMDEDGSAQFASASGSVADSGQPMEILDLVEMIGTQRSNKARGRQVFSLHDHHLKHLQRAQAVATGTPWASFYQPNADETSFGGFFMGAPIFASSLPPTADAGVNRVSCIFSRGDIEAQKKFCAFAMVVARTPRTKSQEEILSDSLVIATTQRNGFGTVAANFATKGRFANS